MDSSQNLVGNVSDVHFLESVGADKSLLCRLRLSIQRVMNYVVLTAAGQNREHSR